MGEIWLAFITGLTAGGLSCLAVQGGLLTGALTTRVEQKVAREAAVPTITAFLVAKLIAYTMLGLLLGWLGASLQINALVRGLLQLMIGVFMLGTALRLLTNHPALRYFVIEPPRAVTRFIRRFAKRSDGGVVNGAVLGAATVLIPCGVTQAMMAAALATGSGIQGAALLFAFTLGTSPLFFALAYLVTRLGKALDRRFQLGAGVLVLIFGLYAIEGGLNLLGSPVSYAILKRSIAERRFQDPPREASIRFSQPSPSPANSENSYEVQVDQFGYQPDVINALADKPVVVSFITNKSYTCARALVIPALRFEKVLPQSGKVTIELPARPAGSVLRYSCSMGMYQGEIRYQ